MLPSRQISVNGAVVAGRTAGVVIGQVTDAHGGRGVVQQEGLPGSAIVAFNHRKALWRTVEVTVSVEDGFGQFTAGQAVTFGLVIDGGVDANRMVEAVRSLGRVIVSLDRPGKYKYAPGLYSISHSGDLFGTVDAQGNITLGAMEHGAEFLNGLDTVAELKTEAARAPTTVKVDVVDGVPVRQ